MNFKELNEKNQKFKDIILEYKNIIKEELSKEEILYFISEEKYDNNITFIISKNIDIDENEYQNNNDYRTYIDELQEMNNYEEYSFSLINFEIKNLKDNKNLYENINKINELYKNKLNDLILKIENNEIEDLSYYIMQEIMKIDKIRDKFFYREYSYKNNEEIKNININIENILNNFYDLGFYNDIDETLKKIKHSQTLLSVPYFDRYSKIWDLQTKKEKLTKENQIIKNFNLWLWTLSDREDFDPKEDYSKTDKGFQLDCCASTELSFIEIHDTFNENNGLAVYKYEDSNEEEMLHLTEKGKKIIEKNLLILQKTLNKKIIYEENFDCKYYNLSINIINTGKVFKEKEKDISI